MVVIREYSDGSGLYLEDGQFTYQLSPRVEYFLNEHGYTSGEGIPELILRVFSLCGGISTSGRDSHSRVRVTRGMDTRPSNNELETLRECVIKELKAGGASQRELQRINNILSDETTLDEIEWQDDFTSNTENLQKIAEDIVD